MLVVESYILDNVVDQPRIITWAVVRQLLISHPHVEYWRMIVCIFIMFNKFRTWLKVISLSRGIRELFLQQNLVNLHFGVTVLFTEEFIYPREWEFKTQNQHAWADIKSCATHPHAHQRRFSTMVWEEIFGDHLFGNYLFDAWPEKHISRFCNRHDACYTNTHVFVTNRSYKSYVQTYKSYHLFTNFIFIF